MQLNVLKIGGGAGVDHTRALENLAERVLRGERWVLVHGASDAANHLAEQVGYPAQTLLSASGHSSRYTDPRTLEIFCAAAATVNQTVTAQLMAYGVNVVGLAAPNVIRARRKTAIRAVRDGRQMIIRDDFSGSITGVNAALLDHLLAVEMLPVVAPLALGEEYERLNVDGDLAAAQIAHALDAQTLVILSNIPGLLRDVCDPDTLVEQLSLDELSAYDHYAVGRMKKKLLAAQTAQVGRMIIADSRLDAPLDAALAGGGTQIVRAGVLEHDYAC